jgi:hypothetical protein
MKDYYEILGVSKNATKKEIKEVFHKLAHIYHPDKKGNDKKMKEINEAYSILSDDDKRKEYDFNFEHFNFSEKQNNTPTAPQSTTSKTTIITIWYCLFHVIRKIFGWLLSILIPISIIIIILYSHNNTPTPQKTTPSVVASDTQKETKSIIKNIDNVPIKTYTPPEYAHGHAPIGCQNRYCPETYDDCISCGYSSTNCKDLPFCVNPTFNNITKLYNSYYNEGNVLLEKGLVYKNKNDNENALIYFRNANSSFTKICEDSGELKNNIKDYKSTEYNMAQKMEIASCYTSEISQCLISTITGGSTGCSSTKTENQNRINFITQTLNDIKYFLDNTK